MIIAAWRPFGTAQKGRFTHHQEIDQSKQTGSKVPIVRKHTLYGCPVGQVIEIA
jgi:hypothetical protein